LWHDVVAAARRCSAATGLGYVGVDLVIDAVCGVQVLECNAYPGLEIQNVNAAGLGGRIDYALQHRRSRERMAQPAQHPARTISLRPLHDLSTAVIASLGQIRGRMAETSLRYA
jgi:hypothetical protein